MEITIQVDDMDQMYERLVEAGVEIEIPPKDQDWGVATPDSGTETDGECSICS